MDLTISPRAELLRAQLLKFMAEHIYPNELKLFEVRGCRR